MTLAKILGRGLCTAAVLALTVQSVAQAQVPPYAYRIPIPGVNALPSTDPNPNNPTDPTDPAATPVLLTGSYGNNGQDATVGESILAMSGLGSSGGTGARHFVPTGNLGGLGFDPATGAISGVPNGPGTISVSVRAVDSQGIESATAASASVSVKAPLSASLPVSAAFQVGVPSSGTAASVSGGTAPYGFAVASGSLPSGVVLDSATGALLSYAGPPAEAAGTSGSVTIMAYDSRTGAQRTQLRSVSWTVSPAAQVPAPVLAGTYGNNGQDATVGEAIGAMTGLSVSSGGTAPFTYEIAAGTLPAGFSFDAQTGAITGTPQAAGLHALTVRAVDANGLRSTGTATASIVARNPLTATVQPTVTLVVGTAYAGPAVAAAGGTAPYSYTISGAPLPAGVNFNAADGSIAGTAGAAASGTSGTATIAIHDSRTGVPRGTSAQVSWSVAAYDPPVMAGSYSNHNQDATAGEAILAMAAPAASGGTGALRYEMVLGALPAGVNFDPATGAIAGTTSAVGTHGVTVRAFDSTGVRSQGTVTATFHVRAPLTFNVDESIAMQTGTMFNGVVPTTTGGTSPYTYELVGALPEGAQMNPANGGIYALSGPDPSFAGMGGSVFIIARDSRPGTPRQEVRQVTWAVQAPAQQSPWLFATSFTNAPAPAIAGNMGADAESIARLQDGNTGSATYNVGGGAKYVGLVNGSAQYSNSFSIRFSQAVSFTGITAHKDSAAAGGVVNIQACTTECANAPSTWPQVGTLSFTGNAATGSVSQTTGIRGIRLSASGPAVNAPLTEMQFNQ